MDYKRSSGIILHPTSFPGPDGIGDLGPEAYRWIDFLSGAECGLWQVLPLGPTGYGDSPYQCFSAFAGNPYMISPTLLMQYRLISAGDLSGRPEFPENQVDFGKAIEWKNKLLSIAFKKFEKSQNQKIRADFQKFKSNEKSWLTDFSLFMAIKEVFGGVAWNDWPEKFRLRDEASIKEFKKTHLPLIELNNFKQFVFFDQWKRLKDYANKKGIKIIGDIPIFVAFDSADLWANPDLFFLNNKGLPSVVAGVPPDYFSPTGQRWGNPLYKWSIHRQSNYAWWISRLRSSLRLFDMVRLDHFRGFAGYWEIPAQKPTAEIGRWVKGPGAHFFKTVLKALGDIPLIAEDLGEITPDVKALLKQFDFPGMKILQFSFASDPDDPFLPHNYPRRCMAYTGTHDNDTTRGWYDSAPAEEKDLCRRYLARSGEDISWDMIRAVWGSVACLALAPMQDLLSLGSEARMNYPGRLGSNWSWRMPNDALSAQLLERLKEINFLYGRMNH